MSRPPVSVIVTASGGVTDFRACLESLRPTLGLRDEVVCVFPTHRTDLRDPLRGQTWLTVLDDNSGDQKTRWSAGVAATRHPVVVLLDGDVVVSAHWLEPVLEALRDPEVVAAGPRCHLSLGPQAAEVPVAATTSVPAFKAEARRWRQEHTGRFTDVERLGSVCVAIRRDALERAGGPAVDLPYDRLRTEGRLVVAHGALVAHTGTEQCALQPPAIADDAPLVSACMIVKDEEDVLAESLTAVWEFVDEIVVYDTGSTDRTRDIAREHGAKVIEGYWNDHFGDARNRSLAHCTGKWILGIDADEVITGDAAGARAALAAAARTERAFMIGVQSITGHGTAVYGRQLSPRFFRRDRVTYAGRIHEQVVHPISGNPLAGPEIPDVDIIHSGYTIARSIRKNKGERNVRLSQLAVDDQKEGPWALVNLARSQLLDGQVDATIETCKKGLAGGPPQHRRHLLRPLIEAYTGSGRYAEARAAIAEFREAGGAAGSADEMESRLCVLEGDFAAALDIVRAIPETALDDMLIAVDKNRTTEIEIAALAGLERHHEAAELIREYLRKARLPLPLPQMVAILTADGSGVPELAALFPRTALRSLLLAVTEVPAALADEVLEAVWQQHGAPMVLATAARLGEYLPVIRAMEWAARLRQHGFTEHCTLVALAASQARTPHDRVLAAAVALELFADDRAMPLLEESLAAVPDDENDRVLDDLRQLAPGIAAAIEPAQAA